MPVDEKTIVVSYAGDGSDITPKVATITGEYIRTADGFRKEGGGRLAHSNGKWSIFDKSNEEVAWVQAELGRPMVVPKSEWKTFGEAGFFSGSTTEDIPITVEFKKLDERSPQAGGGCSDSCMGGYQKIKDRLPQHHRDSVEGLEAKAGEHLGPIKVKAEEMHAQHWPVVKSEVLKRSTSAKETYDQYAPVVKENAKKAFNAGHAYLTHPDTVDKMQKTGNGCISGIKCCAEGALSIICGAIAGKHEAKSPLKESQSDQAMDATYVKLDSTTPVIVDPAPVIVETLPAVPDFTRPAAPVNPPGQVEPVTLAPNKLFKGDEDEVHPEA